MHYNKEIMKRTLLLASCALVVQASASITSVSSGDGLLGNRSLNLVTNGSFEADYGFAANGSFWATGTANTPFVALTGWSSSGQSQAYARWGYDTPGQIASSGAIPHGENALYFGAFIQGAPSIMPNFAANGQVTFAGTPTFSPNPNFGPVTLSQTLTGLNTSQDYLLDFWASGELANSAVWVDGFFGLDITGENSLYFAAAGGQSAIGDSQRYYVVFKPTSSTVTLTFTNWGHYNDANNAFSSELCLDDVIVNQVVPEPASIAALGLGAIFLLRRKKRD